MYTASLPRSLDFRCRENLVFSRSLCIYLTSHGCFLPVTSSLWLPELYFPLWAEAVLRTLHTFSYVCVFCAFYSAITLKF
jgi:hypothetical protein